MGICMNNTFAGVPRAAGVVRTDSARAECLICSGCLSPGEGDGKRPLPLL